MKTNMQWFRVYSEIIDDEKVLLLSPDDRWYFVGLLACKRTGMLDAGGPPDLLARKLCIKLRLHRAELDEVARRLSEVGLIERKTFQPLKWDERQFESDSSKDRVRRFRERQRKQSGSEGKRGCNVTVTMQDTDTDTDTDTEKDKTTTQVPQAVANSAQPCAPAQPVAPEPGSLRNVQQADLPPGYVLPFAPAAEPPKSKTEPIPVTEFITEFNAHMERLPKVRSLTTKRRTQIRRLWHECKDFRRPGFVKAYFETCAADPFLNGAGPYRGGHENWRPTFDYLTRPDTATRVIEQALA